MNNNQHPPIPIQVYQNYLNVVDEIFETERDALSKTTYESFLDDIELLRLHGCLEDDDDIRTLESDVRKYLDDLDY